MMPAAFFIAALPLFLIFSCASREQAKEPQAALEDPPIITSATYQHTLYNGRAQPIEARAAKEDTPAFIITYFRLLEDLERNRNGSVEPPCEVGDYYTRIERPGGNGYRRGGNITIEYHIQKAFITIAADPVQRFAYNGEPKEIAAQLEPPEEPPLVVSYFAAGSGGDALAGPPRERGRYRVTVVFPGNERYIGASTEIELLIE